MGPFVTVSVFVWSTVAETYRVTLGVSRLGRVECGGRSGGIFGLLFAHL